MFSGDLEDKKLAIKTIEKIIYCISASGFDMEIEEILTDASKVVLRYLQDMNN